MREPRFRLIRDGYNEVIQDVEHGVNLFFLATSGFGTNSTTIDLAERVVTYLNSLPPEETLLYPFNMMDNSTTAAINRAV